jgi:hypothetical protein
VSDSGPDNLEDFSIFVDRPVNNHDSGLITMSFDLPAWDHEDQAEMIIGERLTREVTTSNLYPMEIGSSSDPAVLYLIDVRKRSPF